MGDEVRTVNAEEYVSMLMLKFRGLVLGIQEEQRELKEKLRQLPLTPPSTLSSTTSYTATATTTTASPIDQPSTATLSSGTLSGNTGSTRPPPYKSVLKPVVTLQEPANEVPVRPQRRNSSHTKNRATNANPAVEFAVKTGINNNNNNDHHLNNNHSHNNNINDNNNHCHHNRHHTIATANTNHHAHLRNLINKHITMSSAASRGAFIVLEGLDRVGKTTLATKLVDHLERLQTPVTFLRFPDRSTPTGKLINEFLQNSSKRVDDHAMHLLFSANRWELNKQLRATLTKGTTVVVDRYSYSGIAYSSAKRGLSLEWCRETERGLPKPDLVIYLELPRESQYSRPGFGDERYETKDLQDLIRIQYEHLMEMSQETWLRVDVENKSPDQVLGEVIMPVKQCLKASARKTLGDLEFL